MTGKGNEKQKEVGENGESFSKYGPRKRENEPWEKESEKEVNDGRNKKKKKEKLKEEERQ